MVRTTALPVVLLRLLCVVAVLLGGFTKSLSATPLRSTVGDLALYTLPDGSLPPLCVPGTNDDGSTGKSGAAHVCDLCLLGASAFLVGPGPALLLALCPVRQSATDQQLRPEAFYRQFFPPHAPPIGPPAPAIA